MPMLNISLSGKANASASGEITDPTVLLQIKALFRTLNDDALKPVEPVTDPVPPAT